MVKLVDTKDLKSLPYGSASSSPAEGTKKLMINFHFTFDRTKKSQSFKKLVFNKYKNYPAKKASVIVIAGGDGFMLSNIKKYYKFQKPFYGINCGSIGFLLNNFKDINIKKRIKNSNTKPFKTFMSTNFTTRALCSFCCYC